MLQIVPEADQPGLSLGLHLELADSAETQGSLLEKRFGTVEGAEGRVGPDVLDDLVVGEEDVPDADGALVGFEEVCDEGSAEGDESDELGPDIGEGSAKSLQECFEERVAGEDALEEGADLEQGGLLAEGGVEEDVLEEVEQLHLHDVLAVENHLPEHPEQASQQIVKHLFR